MIDCTVEHHHSAYIVRFEDGKSKLIQSDYDQAVFAVDCGLIKSPGNDWDGSPYSLGEAWDECDLEDITECPLIYYEIADVDKRNRITEKDLLAIADIIRRQDVLSVTDDKELDPEGMAKFANTVACRNIRDAISTYLEENYDNDLIPFDEFMSWSDEKNEAYKKEHGHKTM